MFSADWTAEFPAIDVVVFDVVMDTIGTKGVETRQSLQWVSLNKYKTQQ